MKAAPPTATEAEQPALGEFHQIYEEHAKPIYYLALRFLGQASQAEDATHDVFIKAFKKLHTFNGRSSIRTWLYRITINHCRNVLQSWHHRNMHSYADQSVFEHAQPPSGNPLRVLETKELGRRIQETLDALPEEYRLLLLLVADEELSYEEISDLTGQTTDAVRGKLHRARKAFAHRFQHTA